MSSPRLLLPPLAFGTWQIRAEVAQSAVHSALACGWRHIDTAAIYRNEQAVGQGIRQAIDEGIVRRDDVFVTTKLAPTSFGAQLAPQALRDSAARLALGKIDLCLAHWPGTSGLRREDGQNAQKRSETWRALLEAQASGLFSHVGVSNYTVAHLRQLEAQGLPLPPVNQVELHPRLPQKELREWCRTRGIIVQAYSPLGAGHLIDNPSVVAVAQRHQRSTAQVLLRWVRQQDIPLAVRSTKPERMKANLDLDFELSATDMRQLDALADNHHYCWDPSDVA